MPYAQVVTILGGPGTLASQRTEARSTITGDCFLYGTPCPVHYVTVQDYQWPTDKGGQALITFEDGRVSAKTASGF
jgi:hypothetical protein